MSLLPQRLHLNLARRAGLAMIITALVLVPEGLNASGSDGPASAQLEMTVGYGGALPPSGWTPVRVTVSASDAGFEGSVVVWTGLPPASVPLASGIPAGSRAGASLQAPDPSTAVHRQVRLAANTSESLTTYLPDSDQTVTAELLGPRGPVASSQLAPPIPRAGPQIAVVSDSAGALDQLASISLPGPNVHAQVLHLNMAEMPDDGIALRAFTLVAIADASTAGFSPAQRRALGDYVSAGGNLLVVGGSSWRPTVAGLPGDLLALTPATDTSLPGLRLVASALGTDPLTQPVTATAGARSGGIAVLAEGAVPVLVERQHGHGRTFFSSLDLAGGPVASWTGGSSILRQVLLRSLLPGPVSAGWALAPNSGFAAAGGWLYQALATLPRVPIPSFWPAGLLIVAYSGVIGPLSLWILRRRGRPELAWLVVPLLAVVVSCVLVSRPAASDVVVHRIDVIHLAAGSPDAFVERAIGVFAPRAGAVRVDVDRGAKLIGALGRLGYPASSIPTPVVEDGLGAESVDLPVPKAGALQAFGEAMFGPAIGSVEQNLHLGTGRIAGSLTSHLPVPVTGALVVSGDSIQRLGTLAPGARASVDIPVPGAGPGPVAGGLAPLLSSSGAGDTSTGLSASRRQSVAYEVLGANVETSPPLLFGWLQEPPGRLAVDGRWVSPVGLSALVVPLDPVPGLVMAPGDVTARIADLSGSVSPRATASGSRSFGVLGPGAQVTLEFDLAAAGRLPTLSLPDTTSPAPGLGLEILDFATSSWSALSLVPGGSASLPDGPADVSPDGVVRVRETNASPAQVAVGELEISTI